MKIIDYKNLKIEVFSDELYSLNSADNVNTYDCVYSSYNSINSDYDNYIPKYGIRIKDNKKVLKSAVLIAGGGGTTSPHDKSVLIDNNTLITIIGDSIFSLSLPELAVNWKVVCENTVTCFEVYICSDGYIVHGELSILKINKFGQIEWEFFGRDIFTTPEGRDDFQINDKHVIAMDWEHNVYKIDILNGKLSC
jgi:hypothetical protein